MKRFSVNVEVIFATGKIIVHGCGRSCCFTDDANKNYARAMAKHAIIQGEYDCVRTLVMGLLSSLSVQVDPVSLDINTTLNIEIDWPRRTVTIADLGLEAQCSFEEFTR